MLAVIVWPSPAWPAPSPRPETTATMLRVQFVTEPRRKGITHGSSSAMSGEWGAWQLLVVLLAGVVIGAGMTYLIGARERLTKLSPRGLGGTIGVLGAMVMESS